MKKMITFGALAACGYLAFDYYHSNHFDNSQSGANFWNQSKEWPAQGITVHTHEGIPIYSNGEVVYQSYGRHYAEDGYYYGRKWQCVEFIKRFFHDKYRHSMPDVWGHAKQYFDHSISHGAVNPARGLIQYRNAHTTPPEEDDLLVWDGKYGHVAIIAEVHADHIIIAQQNIKHTPLAKVPLTYSNSIYTLGGGANDPLGWLRIP